MTSERLTARALALVLVPLSAWLLSLARVAAQAPAPRIWQGVYTAEQAERGKTLYMSACIRCHGGDLLGTTAPPLTGEKFMDVWGGESVDRLFVKIRETMPPSFGTVLDDESKLDIVTFILQTGGYPAGPRALTPGDELAGIQILKKGEQVQVQNFALVQTVGCLARGEGNTWMLTKTADLALTRDETPREAAAAAAATPLGTDAFLLLSATPFAPESHVGRKVEARGLVYRDGSDARLTLTALTPVGECR